MVKREAWPPVPAREAEVGSPAQYFPTREQNGARTPVQFRVGADMLARMAEVGRAESLNLSDTVRLLLEEALAARATAAKGGA